MQSLEPTAAEYINVWRGGNALAYGSSTLGGAIDCISYTGESAPGIPARAEIGSWDYQRLTMAGGFGEGSRDLFSSFTYQAQDGFRDHAEQENFGLFHNFGWQISENLETRFYLSAIQSNSALPGNLTRAQVHDDPRQANSSNILRDQRRDWCVNPFAAYINDFRTLKVCTILCAMSSSLWAADPVVASIGSSR